MASKSGSDPESRISRRTSACRRCASSTGMVAFIISVPQVEFALDRALGQHALGSEGDVIPQVAQVALEGDQVFTLCGCFDGLSDPGDFVEAERLPAAFHVVAERAQLSEIALADEGFDLYELFAPGGKIAMRNGFQSDGNFGRFPLARAGTRGSEPGQLLGETGGTVALDGLDQSGFRDRFREMPVAASLITARGVFDQGVGG